MNDDLYDLRDLRDLRDLHDLHEVLEARVTGLDPGPAPAADILAGARRRQTARRRSASVTVAVLATAGIAAGVLATTGSKSSDNPASSTASGGPSTPTGFVPVVTRQTGLASGQTIEKADYVPPGDVILSGTVDGVPWQFQMARAVDPPPTDKNWSDLVSKPLAGTHEYCQTMTVFVDHQLSAGGGGCGPDDTVNGVGGSDVFAGSSGVVTVAGHQGLTWGGHTQLAVTRIVWTWSDGHTESVVPVVTPYAKLPFFAFPFGVGGTLTAYDAAGQVVDERPATP